MTRRLPLLVVGVLVLALLSATPAAARPASDVGPGATTIDARLAAELAAAAPTDHLSVIVVLADQVDLRRVRGGTRHQRVAATEAALKSTAGTAQRSLLEQLRQLEASGAVASVLPLWVVNAVQVTATPEVIRRIAARSDVAVVQPDATIAAPQVSAQVATGAPESELVTVRVPALWDLGLHGEGVVVANMDTGVDVSHPDLASKWRGGTNSWFDPNGQHPSTPTDVNGHGTWTMGVMVGGDAGGTSIGAAPGARWIAAKIFDDRGTATATAIHRSFQWLLDPDGNPATDDEPDVVNDSWTLSTSGCMLDYQPDLRSLRAAGILPVFAAGNYGPYPGTVLSPANYPEAFAVGATDGTDTVDPSSSRGPSACTQSVSPRLVAPGDAILTTDLYGGYAIESGTSLAAPLVSGVLALLLQAAPSMTADEQQAALAAGAVDLGPAGPDNDYGAGRVDALASYQSLQVSPDFSVGVSPSSASTLPGGQVVVQVSVTSVNGFAGDVALQLGGLSGTQASWAFSPPVITGGGGSAQLSLTTASSLSPGGYPVTVTATSGALVHSTGFTIIVTSPPDFTVAVSPASRTVAAGVGTSYTVTVSALNGFNGPVSLALSGLPTSVGSATFAPATLSGAGSAQLAVTTRSTAAAGTYSLGITATSGGLIHSATTKLVVTLPDWTLTASPSSRTITRGQSTSYTVTVSPLSGVPGPVALSVSGLPGGSSAIFSTTPVTPPASVTLTIRTSWATPRGTFTLTIVGSGGGRTHQYRVTLVVR